MTKEELEQKAEEIYTKTDKEFMDCQDEGEIFNLGYLAGAEPREKRIAELEKENKVLAQNLEDTEIVNKALENEIAELEAENERIKTKYYELQDTLKKVRLALIKERTANIMNYGKGGVEMFDDCFEILKGVSN